MLLTIVEPHATKIKFLENYRYIDAMFNDGFHATEVLELCEDWDMNRVDAVVLTQCWLILNDEPQTFNIDCMEAERFFKSDGTIKVAEYLKEVYKWCYRCGDELRPHHMEADYPGLCHTCAIFYQINETEECDVDEADG